MPIGAGVQGQEPPGSNSSGRTINIPGSTLGKTSKATPVGITPSIVTIGNIIAGVREIAVKVNLRPLRPRLAAALLPLKVRHSLCTTRVLNKSEIMDECRIRTGQVDPGLLFIRCAVYFMGLS